MMNDPHELWIVLAFLPSRILLGLIDRGMCCHIKQHPKLLMSRLMLSTTLITFPFPPALVASALQARPFDA